MSQRLSLFMNLALRWCALSLSTQFTSNSWKSACNAFLWYKYASCSVHVFFCKQVEAIQRKTSSYRILTNDNIIKRGHKSGYRLHSCKPLLDTSDLAVVYIVLLLHFGSPQYES